MTTVNATNSVPGFDMYDTGLVRWSGTLLYPAIDGSTAFGYTANDDGEGTFAPQNINIYGNGNFTFDGSDNPTGGDAYAININFDNNPNVGGIDGSLDVSIVADSGVTWPLTFVMPAGTNDILAADLFWMPLLAGNDTIFAPSLGYATIAGDGRWFGGMEGATGNDTFSVTGAVSLFPRDTIIGTALVGDVLNVGQSGILHGGADSFTLDGVSLYAVYGDAYSMSQSTRVIGGNDAIVSNTTSQALGVIDELRLRLIGDVRETVGRVDGGNDTITGSDSADVNDFIVGDVYWAITSAPPGWLINGGHDRLMGRGGNDRLVGDVERATFGPNGDVVVGGNDSLYGGAGDDQLYGDVFTHTGLAQYVNIVGGNDLLDGGAGRDTMFGGGGNDAYVFDDIGDQANEIEGSGIDTVYSAIDADLNASSIVGDIENLTLIGTAILGTGNGLGNVIIGNGTANILRGMAGDDFLRGGAGKDHLIGGGGSNDYADYGDKTKSVSVTLKGSHDASVKVGGKTEDKIKGIEHLVGGTRADKLCGDGHANALLGGNGRDTITGGGGRDTLTGGNGADQLYGNGGRDAFVFSSALSAADSLRDFKHNTDIIALDDAIFGAVGPTLGKGEFFARAGAARAHDANDRIVYNKSNGWLYFDDDGKGGHAAVHFATLTGHPTLDHLDFAIV